MPRVNLGKTREELRAEAEERHNKKVLKEIKMQMECKEVSRHELSDMTMISYLKVCRLLSGKIRFDLFTMTVIANALGFSDEQRTEMISGKTS